MLTHDEMVKQHKIDNVGQILTGTDRCSSVDISELKIGLKIFPNEMSCHVRALSGCVVWGTERSLSFIVLLFLRLSLR